MWVRVDDTFTEHHKVLKAGQLLGADGCCRVIAVWLEAMCYANRHLTDGFISDAVARKLHVDRNCLQVLRVMSQRKVGLLQREIGGWKIHDYHNYQPSKAEIEEKRQKERDRKQRVRADVARTKKLSAVPSPAQPSPAPKEQDQEQSAPRTTHKPNGQVHESRRTLVKLAHDVYHDLEAGRLRPDDLAEELKTRAARARLRYDGDRIRKALDSAEHQRHHP